MTPTPASVAREIVKGVKHLVCDCTETAEDCPRCQRLVGVVAQALDAVREEERERCARVAEQTYPRGGAHTYASENADRYIALEDAAEEIAAALRGR